MKLISGLLIGSAAAMILLSGCSSSDNSQASDSVPDNSLENNGDTVKFGHYQDADIEWYVLAHEDGRALLLSVQALDAKPFNETPADWDNSSMRTWLNGEFYDTAFSKEEQQAIILSSLDNGDDLHYGTAVGQNTEDSVFLLSASEAEKYLSKSQIITYPTDYAVSQGVYTNDSGACAWWLRSPGSSDDGPAYYSSQGDIGTHAHKGSETVLGTRPAVWITEEYLNSK